MSLIVERNIPIPLKTFENIKIVQSDSRGYVSNLGTYSGTQNKLKCNYKHGFYSQSLRKYGGLVLVYLCSSRLNPLSCIIDNKFATGYSTI